MTDVGEPAPGRRVSAVTSGARDVLLSVAAAEMLAAMGKFIARITAVHLEGGQQTSKTLYKAEKKKAKVSRWVRPIERSQRRMLEAQQVFGEELLARHKRSNRKRRNGFLRDGGMNLMRAQRKALKRLRKFV